MPPGAPLCEDIPVYTSAYVDWNVSVYASMSSDPEAIKTIRNTNLQHNLHVTMLCCLDCTRDAVVNKQSSLSTLSSRRALIDFGFTDCIRIVLNIHKHATCTNRFIITSIHVLGYDIGDQPKTLAKFF